MEAPPAAPGIRGPAPRVATLVRTFADAAVRLDPDRLLEVRLFGSRARGTARPGSDWDLFLIVRDRDPAWMDRLYALAAEFQARYGANVSLHVYTETQAREARRLNAPFFRRVREEGVTLWTRNSSLPG